MSKKKVHIFIFIDALGWEIIKRHNFLSDMFPYRYPAKMQFGYSSTAIPTILTGEPPEKHKHLSFYYYAPDKSPFKIFKWLMLQYLPSKIFDRWRVRHIFSKIIAKVYGFTGYFELYAMPYNQLPYFDYIEKQDIFVPNGLAPVPNLADVLREYNIPHHISNWRLKESENVEALLKELDEGEINFAFLYTAAMDGLLHMHVNSPEVIQYKLDWYQNQIEQVKAKAQEKYDESCIYIMSDHGMTPRIGTMDIRRKIKKLEFKFGTDYAAVYDSTMARMWFFSDKARRKITEVLEQIPNSRIISDKEKAGYGIDFDDNMYGELILLLDPGWQIEPCDMGRKSLPGMHGYAPEDKDSYASFLSEIPIDSPPSWVGDYFKIMKAKILELAKNSSEEPKG